jgi:hypothetical protein
MNFGEAWKGFMGECSRKAASEMWDHFYTADGTSLSRLLYHETTLKWTSSTCPIHGNFRLQPHFTPKSSEPGPLPHHTNKGIYIQKSYSGHVRT